MKKEYDYVYAIIRADEYQGPNCPTEQKVTIKMIVWDEDAARREVDRLNALGKAEVRYFYQVSRLEKAPVAVAAPVAQSTPGPLVLADVMSLEESATGSAMAILGAYSRNYVTMQTVATAVGPSVLAAHGGRLTAIAGSLTGRTQTAQIPTRIVPTGTKRFRAGHMQVSVSQSLTLDPWEVEAVPSAIPAGVG